MYKGTSQIITINNKPVKVEKYIFEDKKEDQENPDYFFMHFHERYKVIETEPSQKGKTTTKGKHRENSKNSSRCSTKRSTLK
jgi:hypothetical protein